MHSLFNLENIFFKPQNQTILNDINLSINSGDFITISGPSGSGKSTLLKVLASMITPTSGKLLYKNREIDKENITDYRKEVSYFFQQPTLFGETVMDNLIFPFDIRHQEFDKSRVTKLLETFKLNESYLNKKIIDLSGGEKQRVAFVRNLIFEPDVLLLDEVTSALDDENKNIIQQFILNELKGKTILWVTHDSNEFSLGTRQITIIDGKMEEK
ncbi:MULTISPECIES: ATP-binding cassette domain-containing protein [Enterococcaceae]|uniref:ABC transporter ATP-binding protein n=1 Tax=Enterococcaceae TaxID=81852 RepID=UPI000E493374|nr:MULTISPECIES: ATP-binding cassette domain-containing protein [Enterococcaceae]RGI32420.1 ATP-binding cassette domain-containing protein [Melissococcus sp. OM08-11BH]UNM90137.1 ATP-binding cassette domain-containing protein [Vagococcus sp. CY52-2]